MPALYECQERQVSCRYGWLAAGIFMVTPLQTTAGSEPW
jgi:hypothetical protein